MIVFFSIILISTLIVGLVNYTKEQKLNNKIQNSIATRVLSINNINSPIELDDLFNVETSK